MSERVTLRMRVVRRERPLGLIDDELDAELLALLAEDWWR